MTKEPASGTVPGLPEYLSDVHQQSTRLAGVMRAVAHLENEGGCDEGRATLVFLADELAQKLCTALDYVNVPKGGAA